MTRAVALLLVATALLAGCGTTEERTLRYGVIGDSYSNGEGVGPDAAWPVLLADRLDVELVANPAVSGWTTQDALRSELPALEAARPDVATVLIGTNDLVRRVPRATFRQRLRRLYAEVARIVGGPRDVVAVTIPDFSLKPAADAFPGARVEIRAFNAIVREEARRAGIAVAELTAPSRAAGAATPDGLHPGAPELEAWTDAIEPVAREAWDL
jgi:lysophospholipase L1-like esterase